MDIKEVLKTVGSGLLSLHPAGAAALQVINQFLPADKQLAEGSTGSDATDAIGSLPAEQRQAVMVAEIDLERTIEEGYTRRYEAMCAADGQETRARMVNKAMDAMIGVSIVFIGAVAYVYMTSGAKDAFSYEMAGVYVTVTGTFAYVVRAYFGDLKTETTSRHATVDHKPRPLQGIAAIVNAFRK